MPSPTEIAIIVVVVLVSCVLTVTAISIFLNRRKRNKDDTRFLDPHLRGGEFEDQEVVEFMKSGSFEAIPYGGSGLHSSIRPCNLGYTTTSWHELPRTVQPGQASTSLPEYRAVPSNISKIELEATDRKELPPAMSDHNSKLSPLNFSRPSRDNIWLKCNTEAYEEVHAERQDMSSGILQNCNSKAADPRRVSSPTIPTLLLQVSHDDRTQERDSSPVSPFERESFGERKS